MYYSEWITLPFIMDMALFWGLAITSWILTLLLRNREPIRTRGVLPVIAVSFGSCIIVSLIGFREVDKGDFPCGLYLLCINLFLIIHALPFLVRSFMLKLQYSWNNDMLMADKRRADNPPNYVGRYNLYKAIWTWVILLTVCMHLVAMIIEVVVLAEKSGADYLMHGCSLDLELVVFGVISVGYVMVAIIYVISLGTYSDAYWIAWDTRLCILAWLIAATAFFVGNVTTMGDTLSRYVKHDTWIVAATFVCLVYSNYVPIGMALFSKRHKLQSGFGSSTTYGMVRKTRTRLFDMMTGMDAVADGSSTRTHGGGDGASGMVEVELEEISPLPPHVNNNSRAAPVEEYAMDEAHSDDISVNISDPESLERGPESVVSNMRRNNAYNSGGGSLATGELESCYENASLNYIMERTVLRWLDVCPYVFCVDYHSFVMSNTDANARSKHVYRLYNLYVNSPSNTGFTVDGISETTRQAAVKCRESYNNSNTIPLRQMNIIYKEVKSYLESRYLGDVSNEYSRELQEPSSNLLRSQNNDYSSERLPDNLSWGYKLRSCCSLRMQGFAFAFRRCTRRAEVVQDDYTLN